MAERLLRDAVTPDWEELSDCCVLRQGTPQRAHHIELFLDQEVRQAVARRFHLWDTLDADDPNFDVKSEVIIQRFLGYDHVRAGVEGLTMAFNYDATDDTAGLGRAGGRQFMSERRGPIATWEEFEAYPWPEMTDAHTRMLEWYQENLPDDMCIIGGGGFGHFAEFLTWLMGYEMLCYALYDQRDLVRAIADRITEMFRQALERILQFDRVKLVWGSDDMGFRSATLISPDDLREFVLPGHKLMAEMSHAVGRPYLLHSCGNLHEIMEDLIEDVRIDAQHSFEDTIITVTEHKRLYGDRLSALGGIDVDFLCRADEEAIRSRVRETLDACMPGGGYCLGTGNSVANYIPLESYLIMLDEGRRWRP